MLNDGQTLVIQSIIDYVNDNYKFNGRYKLAFDELRTDKDSLCVTTTSDSTPVEKNADVTGGYVSGTLRLGIVLRIMRTTTGMKDLDYISEVDNIYNFIKSNYKSISSDLFYVDKITQVSGAKLDIVYSGGVRDYKGILELIYERKVN